MSPSNSGIQTTTFRSGTVKVKTPGSLIASHLIISIPPRSEPLDDGNLNHEMQLLELWTLLQPDTPLLKRKTKQWQTIGQHLDCPTLYGASDIFIISRRFPRRGSQDGLQGNGNVRTSQSPVILTPLANPSVSIFYFSAFLPKNLVPQPDISYPTLTIHSSGESLSEY